jgi:tetratricopeptide (TPR) repeat protein
VLAAAGLALACAGGPGTPYGAKDPEERLRELLDQWSDSQGGRGGCSSGGIAYPYVDCGRIQAAIERLVLEFPRHPSVLLANAAIAYETRQPEKAQSYLDALLAVEPVQPQAVVLRSRIALQEGNLPLARRLLESQIRLAPDDPSLREALASVQYLLGEYPAARRELAVAERLGAPAWRVAYHRGLVEEAVGDFETAMSYYRLTLEQNSAWERAGARLRALESEHGL